MSHHTTLQCPDFDGLARGFNSERPNLRFEKDSGCFSCLLPTKVCKQDRDDEQCLMSPGVLLVWMFMMGMRPQVGWFFKRKFPQLMGYVDINKGLRSTLNGLLKECRDPFSTQCFMGVVCFYKWCEEYSGDI